MKYQDRTISENDLLVQVRSLMAPANPVPVMAFLAEAPPALQSADPAGPSAWAEPRGQAAQPRRRSRRALRILAPVLSGLAVIAVLVSLTLAGGSALKLPSAGASPAAGTPLPRYFVSINGGPQARPHTTALVHSTRSGRVVTTVPLAPTGDGTGFVAAQSDLEYYIAQGVQVGRQRYAYVFFRLRLRSDGRLSSITKLAGLLTTQESASLIDGIAVSPDGSRLAVALQLPSHLFIQYGAITVFSLRSGTIGSGQTWSVPRSDPAVIADPIWVGDHRIAFLLQDHFHGKASEGSRTQLREFSTTASTRNLLASKVLLAGNRSLGSLQSAFANPAGGPIIATTSRNHSAGRPGRGTAVVRLLTLSSAGHRAFAITTVIVLHEPYDNGVIEYIRDTSCELFGVDATGHHALLDCPRFDRYDNGAVTRLQHGGHNPAIGEISWAAW